VTGKLCGLNLLGLLVVAAPVHGGAKSDREMLNNITSNTTTVDTWCSDWDVYIAIYTHTPKSNHPNILLFFSKCFLFSFKSEQQKAVGS